MALPTASTNGRTDIVVLSSSASGCAIYDHQKLECSCIIDCERLSREFLIELIGHVRRTSCVSVVISDRFCEF